MQRYFLVFQNKLTDIDQNFQATLAFSTIPDNLKILKGTFVVSQS